MIAGLEIREEIVRIECGEDLSVNEKQPADSEKSVLIFQMPFLLFTMSTYIFTILAS
jgi:hypothetical protein